MALQVTQIYNFLNEVTQQSVGGTAISVKDPSSFVSLGNMVLSTEDNREEFYKKLALQIARVTVESRKLKRKDMGFVYDTFQFGFLLEKIRTKTIARVKENNSFHMGTDVMEQVNPFDVIKNDETDIVMQMFSGRGVFEIDKKVWDYQLDVAFQNARQMANFVDLIYADMENGIELAIRDMEHMTLSTSIAESLNGSGQTKRNLLAEYNAIVGTDSAITVAEAMTNKDFLRYASKEINLAIKRMYDVSNLYNTKGAENWVNDASEVEVRVLSDFATSTASYLESDTYHKELVALPNYDDTVNYWQGVGANGDFTARSKVFIKKSAIGGTTGNVEQSGVIAYVSQKGRLGVLFDRYRVKSLYNPASECTDYFAKADKGHFVDPYANAIAFYIAD